ncbi:MAG: endonuclease III [Ignavibacteria bacterium]|nr:endonuclease III [Ignavibacteria bacterium]
MNKITQVINLLKKEFPGLKPVPSKSDPLDVLIATMLSQNTTDKTSYIAFENLKVNFKNWDDVMNAPITKIKDSIRVCGLTNQKSASIQMMLLQMKKKYKRLSLEFLRGKSDPEIYDELLQYNGVGYKTISCMLAFSLGRDVFPVDTHVHRVSNRLGLAAASIPDKTFAQLKDSIPKGKKFLLHTLLIRFGRKICRSKNPLCGKCVLYALCEFKDKELYAGSNNAEPKENNFIILEHI